MIKMKKPLSIIILAAFFFTVGITVAYKNTRQLIYDDSSVFSFNKESFSIYDYNFDYSDIEKTFNNIKNYFPDKHITI